MRLFFALWPDAELRAGLASCARACQQVSGGRLVSAESLHATLAFVGEVDPDQRTTLTALADALPTAGFDLVLDQVGYWPHNRIVYAAASVTPKPLSDLAQTLARQLASAGYRAEKRPYVAHVTLLRKALRAPQGVASEALLWRIGEIALVESVREHDRLVYRPLKRWTLVR